MYGGKASREGGLLCSHLRGLGEDARALNHCKGARAQRGGHVVRIARWTDCLAALGWETQSPQLQRSKDDPSSPWTTSLKSTQLGRLPQHCAECQPAPAAPTHHISALRHHKHVRGSLHYIQNTLHLPQTSTPLLPQCTREGCMSHATATLKSPLNSAPLACQAPPRPMRTCPALPRHPTPSPTTIA